MLTEISSAQTNKEKAMGKIQCRLLTAKCPVCNSWNCSCIEDFQLDPDQVLPPCDLVEGYYLRPYAVRHQPTRQRDGLSMQSLGNLVRVKKTPVLTSQQWLDYQYDFSDPLKNIEDANERAREKLRALRKEN